MKREETDRLCDSLYKLYPRKEGKVRAYAKLRKMVSNNTTYANMATAIENYNRYLKENNVDQQYTLMFSTFVNGRWQDYVDRSPVTNDSHNDLLVEIGLQFQFKAHLSKIKVIWPTAESFKLYLLDKKIFYSQRNNISDNIERFRDFVSRDLSRKLGV
jgi:hypothetical protein